MTTSAFADALPIIAVNYGLHRLTFVGYVRLDRICNIVDWQPPMPVVALHEDGTRRESFAWRGASQAERAQTKTTSLVYFSGKGVSIHWDWMH